MASSSSSSHLIEDLKFDVAVMHAAAASSITGNPITPTAGGLNWLAAAAAAAAPADPTDGSTSAVVYAYQNDAIQVLQIRNAHHDHHPTPTDAAAAAAVAIAAAIVVGSVAVTSPVLNVAASRNSNGRCWVAVATADGTLSCYSASSSSSAINITTTAVETTSTSSESSTAPAPASSSIQFSLLWSVPLMTTYVSNESADAAAPIGLQFNPVNSSTLAVIDAAGGLYLYDCDAAGAAAGGMIALSSNTPPVLQLFSAVSCCAWSPDGTKLAVGKLRSSSSSVVEIYSHNNGATTAAAGAGSNSSGSNALQRVSEIPAPQQEQPHGSDGGDAGGGGGGGWLCHHLDWFAANTIAVGYSRTSTTLTVANDDDDSGDPTHEAALHIVELSVAAAAEHGTAAAAAAAAAVTVKSVTDLGDVVPFFDVPGRHRYWTAAAQTTTTATGAAARQLSLLFVAANVGSDIGLVARDDDDGDDDDAGAWKVVELADAITTPTDADDEFYFPTGMAVSGGKLVVMCTNGSLAVYTPSIDFATTVTAVHQDQLLLSSPAPVPTAAAASTISVATSSSSLFSSRALSEISEEPPDIIDEDDDNDDDEDAQQHRASGFPFGAPGPSFASPTALSGGTTSLFGPSGSEAQESNAAAAPLFGSTPLGQTSNSLSSIFGPTMNSLVSSSLSTLADAAAVPSSFGSPPSATATTTPSMFCPTSSGISDVAAAIAPAFGQTSSSMLGASPSPPTKPPVATPSPSATTTTKGAEHVPVVFGSGTSVPVFGSGTPSLGGFAALAAKAATPDSTKASPFNAFASTASPAALSSVMAKPLFGHSTSSPSPPIVAAPVPQQDTEQSTTLFKEEIKAEDELTTGAAKKRQQYTSGPGAKAAGVFDSVDTDDAGSLPITRLEDLLDELGEGFHGEELDDQVALIDPGKSGKVERSAFVDWYIQLIEDGARKGRDDGDGDASSLDSDEKAEREEEREKARLAFVSLATNDGTDYWITVSNFPRLFESLNTTYCEEEHVKTVKRLQKANSKIFVSDFLDWYVGWLFGGGESSDDEDSEGQEEAPSSTLAPTASSWGNVFAQKEGSWKCDSCMVQNDAELTQCVACEKPRPGHSPEKKTSAAAAAPGSSSIGAGGFSFGGGGGGITSGGFNFGGGSTTTAGTLEAKEGGASGTGIGAGGFSFVGSAATGPSSGFRFGAVSAVAPTESTSGGFHFMPAAPNNGATSGNDSNSPAPGGFRFMSSTPAKVADADAKVEPTPSDKAISDAIDVSGESAKKAARAFDSLDDAHVGYLPTSKMGDLLEELGEGLHGDEFDAQLALIDPDDSGNLLRSAFITWYSNAPTLCGSPDPKASSTTASSKAPTPFGSETKTTAASSSSGYPPMSSKAPTPFAPPQAKPSATSAASAYPPMSRKAPTPFGSETKTSTAISSSGYPPMSSKAPTPFVSPQAKPSATSAASADPPMSSKAPTPFGSETKTSTAFPSSGYPPMSSKAPTPFGSPQPKASATSASSAYPPMSSMAPTPFGSETKSAAGSSSSYPPMSSKAPTPVQHPQPKASATSTSSAYPPFSSKAPTPFGSETKKTAASSSSGFPPLTGGAPAQYGFGLKTNDEKANASFSSGFASVSNNAASPFGMTTVTTASGSGSVSFTPSQASIGRLGMETLSECSLQFTKLVDKMNQSLVLLANGRSTDTDTHLRGEIERHVVAISRIQVDIETLFTSLTEYKGRSASVLGKKAEASRNVSESQRLIARLSAPGHDGFDDLLTQPLDGQSERRRRGLTARAMLAKRFLGIVKARNTVLAGLYDSEGDKALLKSALTLYNSVKAFNEESMRIEQKATDVATAHLRSPKRILRSPLLLKPPRSNLARRTFSSPAPTRHVREKITSDTSSKWDAMEKTFQNLEVPSVKVFSLENASLTNEVEPRNRWTMKERGQVPATPTRVIQKSQPLFSPPLSTKSRVGWNSASTVDRMRMQQVSFTSPLDLRETTLNMSARDALSDYGTTPEKVKETLGVNKRGIPSRNEHASIPTPPQRPSVPSGAPTTTKAAASKLPSAPPMSANAPSSAVEALGPVSSQFKAASSAPPLATYPFPSAASGQSAETSSTSQPLSTPENRKTRSRVDDSTPQSGTLSFGKMDSLGSSLFSSNKSPFGGEPSSSDGPDGSLPDYHKILTEFYQKHNSSKVPEVARHLEKYKGHEKDMFAKLAKKYRVANPLQEAEQSNKRDGSTPVQTMTTGFGFGTSGASPFSSSVAQGSSQDTPSSFMSQKPPLNSSPFTPSSGQGNSQSSFSGGSTASAPAPAPAPAFGASAMSSASPFAQPPTPFSPFGQAPSTATSPSPFTGGLSSQLSSMPSSAGVTFGGKSPREMLMSFYQEKNPSKIAEVDKLLVKYQGQEEMLFRNLAKKYGLNPSVFGLSETAPLAGFGAPAPGLAGSPLVFGQPTPLGGGPTFGMTSFGGSTSTGGFGGTPSGPTGSFGQGFGTAAGASPFGGPSFAALAQSPAPSGFGALAQAPAQPSFGGFGSPPAAPATPFGSPFGAPRR